MAASLGRGFDGREIPLRLWGYIGLGGEGQTNGGGRVAREADAGETFFHHGVAFL